MQIPSGAQVLDRIGVRQGDFDDAASLRHAFEGASQVLIVSAATTGEAALRQHRTAIEAARAAGTERIVYTSHMGPNHASPFPPMADHAATEAMLQTSGVAFTSPGRVRSRRSHFVGRPPMSMRDVLAASLLGMRR